MEQTIHDSFLPTSTPAQSGHPSLITFNNPATMLYHLSTQNLPSNPLSSTLALSAAKKNTKSLLEKPFSSWTPSHRKYAYLLPGWPVPCSSQLVLQTFTPCLKASFLSIPVLPSVARGSKRQSELSRTSYPSPQVCPIPPFPSL